MNFVSARLVSVKPSSAEDDDADVARERLRVREGGAQDDLLRVCDLTKVTSSSPSVSSSVADCLIATSRRGAVKSLLAGNQALTSARLTRDSPFPVALAQVSQIDQFQL